MAEPLTFMQVLAWHASWPSHHDWQRCLVAAHDGRAVEHLGPSDPPVRVIDVMLSALGVAQRLPGRVRIIGLRTVRALAGQLGGARPLWPLAVAAALRAAPEARGTCARCRRVEEPSEHVPTSGVFSLWGGPALCAACWSAWLAEIDHWTPRVPHRGDEEEMLRLARSRLGMKLRDRARTPERWAAELRAHFVSVRLEALALRGEVRALDRMHAELNRFRILRQMGGLHDPREALFQEVRVWRAGTLPMEGRLLRISALALLAWEEERVRAGASRPERSLEVA